MPAELKELSDIKMGSDEPAVGAEPKKPDVPATPAKPEDKPAEKTEEARAPLTPGHPEETEEEKAVREEAEAVKAAENGEPKKSKGGFQKRIDKLTRQNRELEERLAASEANKETPKVNATEKPVSQPAEDAEPKEEDFPTYAQFVKATAIWATRQADKERQQREAVEAEAERTREVFTRYNQGIAQAREKYEDWDEVSEASANIILPPSAQVCIMESENGPEIIYHLCKHPEEASKLIEMSPARVAVEIGRISAKLESANGSQAQPAKPAEPEKLKSKAPEPIKPLGGTAKTERSLADLSVDEFIEARNKEERARRARV